MINLEDDPRIVEASAKALWLEEQPYWRNPPSYDRTQAAVWATIWNSVTVPNTYKTRAIVVLRAARLAMELKQ